MLFLESSEQTDQNLRSSVFGEISWMLISNWKGMTIAAGAHAAFLRQIKTVSGFHKALAEWTVNSAAQFAPTCLQDITGGSWFDRAV